MRQGHDATVGETDLEADKNSREQAIERLKRLARALPPGFKFDREDANRR